MSSTINIVGTGGIIEGNLETANVDVNLDSALYFSGDTDPSVSDHVTMGDQDFISTGSMTLSAWIKPETNTTHGANIIGKQQNYNTNSLGYGLYWRASLNTVYFNVGDGSHGDQLASANLAGHVDSWIHIAGIYNASSKAMVLYVNGVSVDTGTATSCGDLSSSHLFRLGANGSDPDEGDAHFKGYIADARIYTSVKDQPYVQKLAAKINVNDPNNDSNYGMVGWWKCNDGSGSNIVDHHNVGTDYDGTFKRNDSAYSTDIWKFDQYSVNVQDNTTTTEGAVTVTQGKLEGLSLTSVDFDGSADYITCGDTADYTDAITVSCWAKIDDITPDGDQDGLVTKHHSTSWHTSLKASVSGTLEFYINNAARATTAADVIVENRWHHLVFTYDRVAPKIYVDGVLSVTGASYTAAIGTDSVAVQLGRYISQYLNGSMRDVRLKCRPDGFSLLWKLQCNARPLVEDR
jgi:hypothetical protein